MKSFRSTMPVETVPPDPGPRSLAVDLPPGQPCHITDETIARDLVNQTCLAYIEFDDSGEPYRAKDGTWDQLNQATALLKAAMRNPASAAGKPLINEWTQPTLLMFVHGWENNASDGPPENHFVQGTKDLMNLLKEQYKDVWIEGKRMADDPDGPPTPARCIHADDEQYRQQNCTLLHHPVVGVYISWRGAIASESWPVSQVLSYWNRRDTAYHVGNTSLTDAVMQLSAIAHRKTANPNYPAPYVLMIGHSFGALILERALSQAYMRMVTEQLSASSTTPDQLFSLADQIGRASCRERV